MRNGIPYGGGVSVDAEENQILIGDGKKGIKGSDFYTTYFLPTLGTRDFYYKKNENGTYTTKNFEIANKKSKDSTASGTKITSIKLQDLTDNSELELLTKENLNALINTFTTKSTNIDNLLSLSSSYYTSTYKIQETSSLDESIASSLSEEEKTEIKIYQIGTQIGQSPFEEKWSLIINLENTYLIVYTKETPGLLTYSGEIYFNFNNINSQHNYKIIIQYESSQGIELTNGQYSSIPLDSDEELSTLTTYPSHTISFSSTTAIGDPQHIIQINTPDEIYIRNNKDNGGYFLLRNSGKLSIVGKSQVVFTDSCFIQARNSAQVNFNEKSITSFRDNANTIFSGYASTAFSGYARTTFLGHSSFTATDNSYFLISDNAKTSFRGDSETYIDGSGTRFTMHDGAKMDLTGGTVKEDTKYPEVYMHGKATVVLTDYRNCGKEQGSSREGPEVLLMGTPFISVQDDALISMSNNARFIMQSDIKSGGTIPPNHPTNVQPCTFLMEEYAHMNLKDYSSVIIEGNTNIQIGDFTSAGENLQSYAPTIIISDNTEIDMGAPSPSSSSNYQLPSTPTWYCNDSYHENSPHIIIRGRLNIQIENYPFIKISENPWINIDGQSTINIQDYSHFYSMGASKIILNGTDKCGPCIMISAPSSSSHSMNQMIISSSGGRPKPWGVTYNLLTLQDEHRQALLIFKEMLSSNPKQLTQKQIDAIKIVIKYLIEDNKITLESEKCYTTYEVIEPDYAEDFKKWFYLKYPRLDCNNNIEDEKKKYDLQKISILKKSNVTDSINTMIFMPNLSAGKALTKEEEEEKFSNEESAKYDTYYLFRYPVTHTNKNNSYYLEIDNNIINEYCLEKNKNREDIVKALTYVENVSIFLDYYSITKKKDPTVDNYIDWQIISNNKKIPYQITNVTALNTLFNKSYHDNSAYYYYRKNEENYIPTCFFSSLNTRYINNAILCMNENSQIMTDDNFYGQLCGNSTIYFHNNSFLQFTGNAHEEVHNNSKIILRGKEKNINTKPWQDGISFGREFVTPVLQTEDSPIIGLYDSSNFIMHGVWDTTTDLHNNGKLTFKVSSTDTLANTNEITWDSIKDKQEFKEAQKKEGKYYLSHLESVTNTNGYDTDESEIKIVKSNSPDEDDNYIITVSNFTYTTRPPDWEAHPKKIENNPLLELFDNAEIRLGGNISIYADNYTSEEYKKLEAQNNTTSTTSTTQETIITAITFKDKNSHSVSFSIDELIQLKKLLNNTISS